MACALTSGRTEPCKNGVGGLKKAYFMDYVENAFTVTNGEATAINVAITEVFDYVLRATNNTLTEALVSAKDTGTTVNTQTLEVRLKKQDAATSNQIKLMAHGRPIIVVVGNDNSHKVMGISEGCDLTGSNIQSGQGRADFNGYDLTFTAEEVELAPTLNSATVTALEALISDTNIDS
jgi:hypothetical protein